MKRVFSAIELSENVRSSVEDYSGNLARRFPQVPAKWSRTGKLHLTLRFFGNVEEAGLEAITDAHKALAAAFSPFRLSIEGTGVFPNLRRPRVLWLGVSGAETLGSFRSGVDEELAAAGIEPEEREFRPHLTIARLKGGPGAGSLAKHHLSQDFEPVDLNVARIVIFESVLKPTGSKYTVLETAEFLK
ncbi:MAG: RNA 2',3'-cyclic phosphodiesterase [Aridibacter famidurans]|nr:RNA 2',3'-cyclic phosphodiesterase [Aridibacter famidurans]